MLKCLRKYWSDIDAMATIEYSILLMLIALAAATAAGRLGDVIVDIVDQATELFE